MKCRLCKQDLPPEMTQRCEHCVNWDHIGHRNNNGYCRVILPPNLPEWVYRASSSVRRSAGRDCQAYKERLPIV
jgi:hypothetical protein